MWIEMRIHDDEENLWFENMKGKVNGKGRRKMAFSCLLITAFVFIMLVVPLLYNPLGAIDTVEAGRYGNITPTDFELQLLDKINENRSDNGAEPLSLNTSLWWVARAHSQDMIDQDFFDHASSEDGPFNGASFGARVRNYAEYQSGRIGECIAWNSWGPDPEWCMSTWKDSSGHWNIIIDPDYNEIGLGIIQGNYNGWSSSAMYTADFGGYSLSVDLQVEDVDIEFSPSSPIIGDQVTITTTVHNLGDTDAYPVEVNFFDGDPDSGGVQLGETQEISHILIQGETVQVSVQWDTQGETPDHDIYVVVDNSDLISETNEANNKAFRSISLGGAPNPEITLSPGWNLVSFPYIVSDTSLKTVLSSIGGKYDKVQTYDPTDTQNSWKNYNSQKPEDLNQLSDLDNSLAFWIHVTDPSGADLAVEGTAPSSPQSIQLHAGWNLVSYPSETERSRNNALNNLDFGSDVLIIQYYDEQTDSMENMGVPDRMKSGKGYLIYASTGCEWVVNV
jgi:uncharacterized protein YkwD